MDKAVATNSEGILSIDNDLEAEIEEMNINIPIF